MKILNKDSIYVQISDILFLYNTRNDLSKSINNCYKFILEKLNDKDYNTFVRFKDKKTIKFLNNLDYIISYNEYINKSKEELMKDIKKTLTEYCFNANKYNNLNKRKREKNISLIIICEELKYKAISIRNILYIKDGFINIKIPSKVYKNKCK